MGLMDGLWIATSKMVTLRVSSVFYSNLPYLRMVSSVLELIIFCGRCRPLQMVPPAYFFSFLADDVVRILLQINLFTDGVVRFGMNNCMWTVSSLADGALCIFVSFLTDGVFRFFMQFNLFTDGVVRILLQFNLFTDVSSVLELICLWTVSSLFDYMSADGVVRFEFNL